MAAGAHEAGAQSPSACFVCVRTTVSFQIGNGVLEDVEKIGNFCLRIDFDLRSGCSEGIR